MKSNRKALLLALCALLLVVTATVGTLAYFTDTEAVKNTFTVGKVGIDLNETDVDKDQNTKANAYHLLPGLKYEKDPTVTVDADSEESYVRMMVKPSNLDALKEAFPDFVEDNGFFLLQNLVEGWNPAIWKCTGYKDGTYEFRYHTTVGGETGKVGELEALFTHVVIPDTADNADMAVLAGMEIDVVAHAIQAAGFADADDAWHAFDVQHGLVEPDAEETTEPVENIPEPPIGGGIEWLGS